MNGRLYDPRIGRFLQPDPFVSDPANSQSHNRYAYVGNQPLARVDPSGFMAGGIEEVITSASRGGPSVVIDMRRTQIHFPEGGWTVPKMPVDGQNYEVTVRALGFVEADPAPLKPGKDDTVGAASENKDQKARALQALSDLRAVMLDRIEQNPSAAISISDQELGVLFEGSYFQTLDQPRHANFRGGWNEPSVMAQFAVADTFLYSPEFTSRQLNVNGQLVWGGHVNYIAVGMLAAHYGPNMYQSIPALVAAHNVGQVAGRHGQGVRNLKDISPGTRWALMGADYYNRRQRVVVR